MEAFSTFYPWCMTGFWQTAYGKCSHKMSWLDQTSMLLSRTTRLSAFYPGILLKAVEKSLPGPGTIQKVVAISVRPIF